MSGARVTGAQLDALERAAFQPQGKAWPTQAVGRVLVGRRWATHCNPHDKREICITAAGRAALERLKAAERQADKEGKPPLKRPAAKKGRTFKKAPADWATAPRKPPPWVVCTCGHNAKHHAGQTGRGPCTHIKGGRVCPCPRFERGSARP